MMQKATIFNDIWVVRTIGNVFFIMFCFVFLIIFEKDLKIWCVKNDFFPLN